MALRGQPAAGAVGGLLHDGQGLRRDRLSGHDVGPVTVHRDEQLLHAVVQRPAGVVTQVDVVGADLHQ